MSSKRDGAERKKEKLTPNMEGKSEGRGAAEEGEKEGGLLVAWRKLSLFSPLRPSHGGS